MVRERTVWDVMQELHMHLVRRPRTQQEMAAEWLSELARRAGREEDRWYRLKQCAQQLAERIEDAT